MRLIPYFLIGFRFFLGIAIILNARTKFVRKAFLPLLVFGVFTDYIDGIFCRLLGGGYPLSINVWDGYADISIFVSGTYFIFNNYWEILKKYKYALSALIALQLMSWGFSLVKFGRMTTYHSYGAKLWSVIMLLSMIEIVNFKKSRLLPFMLLIGILSNIEEIGITHTLLHWKNNVPSLYHAIHMK